VLSELEVRRAVDVAVLGDGEVLSWSEAVVAEDASEAVAVVDEVVRLNYQLVVDDWLSTSPTVTSREQSTHRHFSNTNFQIKVTVTRIHSVFIQHF